MAEVVIMLTYLTSDSMPEFYQNDKTYQLVSLWSGHIFHSQSEQWRIAPFGDSNLNSTHCCGPLSVYLRKLQVFVGMA